MISLLLCVGTAFLWVRGYRRFDNLYHRGKNLRVISFTSTPGKLVWGAIETTYENTGLVDWEHGWVLSSGPVRPISRLPFGIVRWSFLGFYWSKASVSRDSEMGRYHYTASARYFATPDWFLFILTAILPIAW